MAGGSDPRPPDLRGEECVAYPRKLDGQVWEVGQVGDDLGVEGIGKCLKEEMGFEVLICCVHVVKGALDGRFEGIEVLLEDVADTEPG